MLARLVLLLLLVHGATAWISTSQAKYGSQLDELAAASHGTSRVSAFRSLGGLWSLPRDPLDPRGLGGSITWALDPALCEHMLPRMSEGFWTQTFVGCGMLKSAIQRALDAWSINHALISFTDVSSLCDIEAAAADGDSSTLGGGGQLGMRTPRTGCSHAELYMTVRGNATSAELLPDGRDAEPAQAITYPQLTNSFRYTNGESPIMLVGGLLLARQVVEVKGGRIEFDTSPFRCYYLDHAFCAPFNAMKRSTTSSSHEAGGSQAGGVIILFLLWGIPMAMVVVEFLWQVGEPMYHDRSTRVVACIASVCSLPSTCLVLPLARCSRLRCSYVRLVTALLAASLPPTSPPLTSPPPLALS